MVFKDLLLKTRFIKKYSNKKPDIEYIIKAIETANEGPSAGNLQPIHYTIVEEPENIAVIAGACQQEFIAKAPYVVIVTSDIKQMKRLFHDKAEKYLKQNVGSAIQNFTLQLADSGISSSLVAPFAEDILRENFKISEGLEIEMIITLGYGIGDTKKVKRPSLINKIFFEKFGNKFHKPVTKVRRKDV